MTAEQGVYSLNFPSRCQTVEYQKAKVMFKGLSHEICQQAWELVLPAIRNAAETGVTNKLAGTIVVLYPGTDVPVFTAQIDPDQDQKYVEIASKKALLSARTGMPSSVIQQQCPHLYEIGDTKWGGSTVMPGGIVVAFSGVQAVFDEMIAEWVASAIRAICRYEMTKPDGVMLANSAIIGVA